MRLGSYIPSIRHVIGQHTAGLLKTAPGRYLMAQQPGFVRAATNLVTIAEELEPSHSLELARTLVRFNFINPHRFDPESIPLTQVKENHFSVLLPHEMREAAQKICETLNDCGWNVRFVSNLFIVRSTPRPFRSTRSAGDIQRERQEIVQSIISYLGDSARTRPILKEELFKYVTGKFPDVTQQLITAILNDHRVMTVHQPGDEEPDDAVFMAILTRCEESDREQLGYFHKSLWRKFRHDLVRVAGFSKGGQDQKARLTDHWEYFAGGFRSELETSSQWAQVSSLDKGSLWVRRETLRRLIAHGLVVRVLGGDHDRFIPHEDLFEHSQKGRMMIGSERGLDVGVEGNDPHHLHLVFEYRLPDLKQQIDSIWEQARLGLSVETRGELDSIYQKARDLAVSKGRWSQNVFGRTRFAFEHVGEVVELVHELNGDAYEILAVLLHMVPRDALTRDLRDISMPILFEDNRAIRREPISMKHFLDHLKLFLFQGYYPANKDPFYLEKMMGFALNCLTNESLRRVALAAHAAPLMRAPIGTSMTIEDKQILNYSDTFLAAFAEGSQYFIPQIRNLLFWLTEVPYMLLHERRYIQASQGIEQATKMTRIDMEKKLNAVGTELKAFLNEHLADYEITVSVTERAKSKSSAGRKLGRFDRHSGSVYQSVDEQRDLGGLYVIDESAKNLAEERMHLDLIVPLCMEFCAMKGWPAVAKSTKYESDVRSLEFTIAADNQGHLPTEIQAMGRSIHDALQMYGDVAHYFYKGKINFKADVPQSARWIESLSPGASPYFYYFVPWPETPWGDMWILEEPIAGSPLLMICNRVMSDWSPQNPYADGFQGFDVYWLHPDEKVNLAHFNNGHPLIEPVQGVSDTHAFSKQWEEVRRPDPPVRKNPLLHPASGPKRIPIIVPVFRKGIPAIHQTTQGVKHLNREVDRLIAQAQAANGGLLDFHHPLAPNPRAILMARTGGGVQELIAQAARKADETLFLEKLIPPGVEGRNKLPDAVRQLGFRDVNEFKAFVGAILIRIENLKQKDIIGRTAEFKILEAIQNAILAECNIPAIPDITVENGQVTVYFPQVPDRIGLLNRLLSHWQHPILAVRLHTTPRYRKPQFLASITFSYPTAVARGPVPQEFDNVHKLVQELMKGTSTPVRVPVDASHPVEMKYDNLTAPDMRELRKRLQALSDLSINVTQIIVKEKVDGRNGNGILYRIELTFPTRESLEKYSSEVNHILALSLSPERPSKASSL